MRRRHNCGFTLTGSIEKQLRGHVKWSDQPDFLLKYLRNKEKFCEGLKIPFFHIFQGID
jgi:hypothetical protein